MSTAKRLAWIAAGYAVCIGVGIAAVAVNELRMLAEAAQSSSGMAAFGDVILFVLVTGFFGLVPTWFALTLFVEKAPRTLLAMELVLGALGPASWLAVTSLAGSAGAGPPQAIEQLLSLFTTFVAFPRIILGPVFVVIEGATFVLARGRVARAVLAVAMLMDVIPLGIFALHLVGSIRY
jgi:hypothetical protein